MTARKGVSSSTRKLQARQRKERAREIRTAQTWLKKSRGGVEREEARGGEADEERLWKARAVAGAASKQLDAAMGGKDAHRRGALMYPTRTLTRAEFRGHMNNFHLFFSESAGMFRREHLKAYGTDYAKLKRRFPEVIERCEGNVSLISHNGLSGEGVEEALDDYYKIYSFLRRGHRIPNRQLFP